MKTTKISKAEIISIGTELLLGNIVDTNAQYISKTLSRLGVNLYFRQTVGDSPSRLIESLKLASTRSDLIITIGGLGPTIDDITIKTVANFTHAKLVKNDYVIKKLESYFLARGLKVPPDNFKQALIPEKGTIIKNEFGTAPGIMINYNSKLIIMLPGPPNELIPMFDKYIFKLIKKRYALNNPIISKTIKLTSIGESIVNGKVKDLLKLSGEATVGIYACNNEVHLVITAKCQSPGLSNKAIKEISKKIYARLNTYIFGEDGETLESGVGKLLNRKKLTLSIAESATGGLVANRITDISGSSAYFIFGGVFYSNRSKADTLKVSERVINKFGAVSKETADLMAKNIRTLCKTSLGLSITGIAGPTGGSKNKPIGTHYIAINDGRKSLVKKVLLTGDRKTIKYNCSQQALSVLWRYLKGYE